MRTPEPGSQPAVPLGQQDFVDQLPVGVAELALDGTVLRANPALRDLLRRPGTRVSTANGPDDAADAEGEGCSSVVGLDLDKLGWSVPGGDFAVVVASLMEGAACAGSTGRVLRLRHEDGTELFLRIFLRAFKSADPKVAFLAAFTDATAEVLSRRAVADSERRFRMVFDASPEGWAVFTVAPGAEGEPTKIVDALLNIRARMLVGRVDAELCGEDIGDVLGWASGEWIRGQVSTALARGQAPATRTPVEVAGQWRLVESSVVRLDAHTVMCSWRDVTDLVDAERRLSQAYEETAEMRATLQTALDATSDGFAIYELEWDDNLQLSGARVVHANAAGAESLGLSPETMIGMDIHDFFPGVEATGLWSRIVAAATTKEPQHHRVLNFDAEGRFFDAWDNTIAPVGEERLTITWRDVSDEERALRTLARTRDEAMHSATHDALTDLPNRVLLRQHLLQALRTCLPEERVALVFVDLDHFKAINDTYGHAAGDTVLKATAGRLGRIVRHGDLAARLAGDEFVLVLTHLASDWTPAQFFARATAMLSEPVTVDGVELRPSASLGAVLADPVHERVEVDELIKRADAAMYRSKAARR